MIYFTDGAASQYKNKKNFANLCSHEADFGLKAEWHFFASCHGKSACDEIGGTLKRLARLASLQRHSNNQITNPEQLFLWAKENVDNIKTFYVSSDVVKNNAATIERRMGEAVVVQGTRSLHCYIPINSFQLKASSLSGPESDFKVYDVLPDRNIFDLNTCVVKDFIACIYEENGLWYVAQICSIDLVNSEFKVKFMSPDGESGFIRGYKPTKDFAMVSIQCFVKN